MTEEIHKNIYRIEVGLPNSPLKTLNAYLIKGSKGDYLIDTGYRADECLNCLQSGLDELGCNKDRLNVILTHMHTDHTGLFDKICGREGSIFMSKTDHLYGKEYEKGVLHRLTLKRMYESGLKENEKLSSDSLEALAGDFFDPRFTDLNDQDEIDTGEYKLRAILTPGHTPGHMVYYIEDEGIAFIGDNVLYGITPNITVFPNTQNSLGDYLSSLEMLKNIKVRYAFPSHRRIDGDYYSRIDELKTHHIKRLEEITLIIREESDITPYEIASRMKWKIRYDDWEHFPNTQKWFAIGECNSHLDYLEHEGIIGFQTEDGIRKYYLK